MKAREEQKKVNEKTEIIWEIFFTTTSESAFKSI